MKRKCTVLLLWLLIAALAFPGLAFAETLPEAGWMNFVNGGYICIPEWFDGESCSGNPPTQEYAYNYYDASREMLIMLIETPASVYDVPESRILAQEFDSVSASFPEPTYVARGGGWLVQSGYFGYQNDSVYYAKVILAHHTVYSIRFYYPTVNRRFCDAVVGDVCDSFSASGVKYTAPSVPSTASGPGPEDLDRIHANIKYPNYSFMYLDDYIVTTVTRRAAYVFRDPDRDIWRSGNYYTVTRGTSVTILAESEGYACVIVNDTQDAGWINCDYLAAH